MSVRQRSLSARLGEGGLERGELLSRGVGTGIGVTLEFGQLDDQIVEKPAIPAGNGALVALERPGVLRFAADVPFLRCLFHMIAHRAAGDAVGPSLDRKHIVLRYERKSEENTTELQSQL